MNTVLLDGRAAAGTGVVLTGSGEVLTNNHVIRGATSIKVTVPSSGKTYRATVLGYSFAKDVALLKLSGAGGLRTVTTGTSGGLSVGTRVVAVGNSGGAGLRTKSGKISRLSRTLTVADDGITLRLTSLIETDAPLEPGDSGGPLLEQGRVVGIDAAASRTFSFQSVQSEGFAIPIDTVLSIAHRVESGRASSTVHVGPTAFLGVSLGQSPGGGTPGAVVRGVATGSPAAKAGIGPNSLITSFAGTRVTSENQLRALVLHRSPGDAVKLVWINQFGARKSGTVRLATGPPQ